MARTVDPGAGPLKARVEVIQNDLEFGVGDAGGDWTARVQHARIVGET